MKNLIRFKSFGWSKNRMADQIPIIDTFSFNGEPIVELRLKYLYKHVDEIIIVEACETHAGTVKEGLYIDKHALIFRPYLAKIKFLVIDKFPDMPERWVEQQGSDYMTTGSHDAWFRERYQRDYAQEYIKAKYKNDRYIAMVCDVDEIPSVKTVQSLRSNYFGLTHPLRFEMKFFYYNFSWVKKFMWYHAYCINDLGASRQTFSQMRTAIAQHMCIRDAGWHASYFFNTQGLRRKLESFAHRECDVADHKKNDYLDYCIRFGKDVSARGEGEDLVDHDVSMLPKEFQDFQRNLMFLQEFS
jgi:hypothetical protein